MISPGTLLGRYKVRARLGAGAMGEVYLAFDPDLERSVAVKVLPAKFAGDSIRLARFVREAKAASALSHPNILTVHDLGSYEDSRFLVTEYVEGRTLREWLEEGLPPLGDVLGALRQAAMALGAAHEIGIVHRDIKPENLMLRRDGLVKVLDFGIAKLTAEVSVVTDAGDTSSLFETQAGVILGTVRYMSPEQAGGEPVDARSDVWSLGVVLYELIAGRSPFTGRSAMDTIADILTREPEPLERAAPGTPEPVCRLVERALRKVRDERPDATELAAELGRFQSALEQYGVTMADERQTTADAGPQTTSERTAPPTNLPPATSPLVGRARELGDLLAALRDPATRLVTVTGAGGSGKTRLAVGAARGLVRDFEGGVFAVELSQLRMAAHVAGQVAEALGVNEMAGATLAESLARFLAGREMLLLLDNFEHVVDAAPLVGDLLAAAPGLKVLVTSRSPIHLRLEREFALEPLDLPASSSLPSVADLARVPAVALFVERASEARPSFTLTADNAPVVSEICRRLDGLPLAIELAAARVRFLTPHALLVRLDHRLKLLTGGSRDLPDRQQTMRSAVAWSYDLLEESEQHVLRRLSVFAGGCLLQAAEAVCEAGDVEVLDAITSLADKSLLRHREQFDGQVRFTMLAVVREFGLERLDAEGEADSVRLAHARHYARFAAETKPLLKGANPGSAIRLATLEHENLRQTLDLLFDRAPGEAARLVVSLWPFWQMSGLFSEGYAWIERALRVRAIDPPDRVVLLLGAGDIARQIGRLDAAGGHAQACIEAARAVGDTLRHAIALNTLGMVRLLEEAGTAEVRACFEEGLSLLGAVEHRRFRGILLANLGCVALLEDDYARARACFDEAVEIEGKTARTDPNITTFASLGETCYRMGDTAAAWDYYRDSVSIASEFGNLHHVAVALDGLAAVALDRGEPAKAARLGGASEGLRDRCGAQLQLLEQRLHDDYVAKLGAALEVDEFALAWDAGRTGSIDEVIEELLRSA